MRKIISLVMCLMLILNIGTVAVSAATVPKKKQSDGTTVGIETVPTYTISIPAYIEPESFGTTQYVNSYTVSASNVFLPEGSELDITVNYDGILTENHGVELPYKLYNNDKEITNGQTIISKEAGNPNDSVSFSFTSAITEKPKYSGVYKDTVTFNASALNKIPQGGILFQYYDWIDNTYAFKAYKGGEFFPKEILFDMGGDSEPDYVLEYLYYDHYIYEKQYLRTDKAQDIYPYVESPFAWICCGMYNTINPNSNNDPTNEIKNYTIDKVYEKEVCPDILSYIDGYPVIEITNTAGGKSIFPENLKSSPKLPDKIIGMSGTFAGCTSLVTAPVIPDSVISMDRTFAGCTALATAPVVPDGVKSMKDTFRDCTGLATAPVIPDGVISIDGIFSGCTSLTGEIVVNANPTSYTGAVPDIDIVLTGTSYLLPRIANGCRNVKVIPASPEPASDDIVVDKTVPEGAFYFESEEKLEFDESGSIITKPLTQGDTMPEITSSVFPIFQYGDYTYMYRPQYDGWVVSLAVLSKNEVTGKYDFITADESKTEYGKILASINGKKVCCVDRLFAGCKNLITAPTIPCTIVRMEETFSGCTSLTGSIVINANPSYYSKCLNNTSKPIILRGNSVLLNELKNTGWQNNSITIEK